ncbi:GGDEF domain-containing protein [Alishewanella longhuensis]|uniref:diguanylate cyclase n=1 Tax=Alishewanella longhuensis TaxID=1091037 RepID=A0ABQ3L215_9ALTE|nr:ligand-binding sensor domain-containing diguanylate cyclase [Alishewanella longhuensis]GHG76956.1 GGDEF domain-containing protein [Alishewanella longhuensis]
MRRLVWFFVLLSLSLSLSAAAENRFTPYADYLYRIWSVESGLPQISVQTIVQDADGFIWLGTQNGLARFDGQQFEVFNTANTPLLPSNLISSLLIDDQQQLWIGTANGLIKRVNYQFVNIEGGRVGNINALLQTEDGKVWVGADQLYYVAEQGLQNYREHQSEVFSLLQSSTGLWVGAVNGVGLVQDNSYQWLAAPVTEHTLQFHELGFYQNALWLGSQAGLYLLDEFTKWQPITLPDSDTQRIELIFNDQQQGLWISTLDRLFRWYKGELIEQIIMPEQDNFSWVESMLQDIHGNLWLGSRSHGVKRLRKAMTERYGTAEGISDPYTWAVQPWQQYLMVGNRKGVELFDPTTRSYQQILGEEQLPNPFVYSFFTDKAKQLWVGTRGGVAVFDEATLEPLFQLPTLAHLLVTSFAEQDKRLWLGTNGGLYFYEQQNVVAFEHSHLPAEVRVRSIFPDARGQLWIGTEVGLFVKDRHDQVQRVDDPVLGHSFITTVFALPDGQLFIGTFDRGFSIGEQGSWQRFTQQEGLPGNGVIYVHLQDDMLIVSNFQGIYRLNYPELRSGVINELYMLVDDRRPEGTTDSHRCCNGAGASKGALHADRLWFPTLNGIVAVGLNQLNTIAPLPKPVITAIRVDEHTYHDKNFSLAAGQRDWQVSFSAPYFIQALSLQFRYQLRGYDDSWVYAGNRREAFYTNLAPGHYQFTVQVKSAADYRWSDSAYVSIYLPAKWYEAKWFIFMLFFSSLMLLWGIYRLRVAALDRAQRRLQQLVAERTEALHQANIRLQQISMEDALTGLHNRHYLSIHIEQLLARAQRNAMPLMWVLLDIDHFKQINDRLGHQVGDNALKQVARILQENSRSTDHLLRWGGEEFLLILEDSANTEQYLQRLQKALTAGEWQALGLNNPLTCSIGAMQHLPEQDWQSCLQLADLALYQVKNLGRDGYLLLKATPKYPVHGHPENMLLAELVANGWLSWQSDKQAFTSN